MEAACIRALEAIHVLEERASSALAELDNMTIPGVVRAPLDEEDSLVISLQTLTKQN